MRAARLRGRSGVSQVVIRCIALLVVLLAAALGAAAPAGARVMQTGIADDAILLSGGPAAADAVKQWQALGVDVVRIQVSWARVAPTPESAVPPPGFQPANPSDPEYRWGAIDAAVDRLTSAGIKPILMLDGPPPLWASGNPARSNPRYRPSAPAFANFATAAAGRYGDRVDQYILWNEPNLPVWMQPQADCGKKRCTPVSPNVYRAMVLAAYPAIHAADPVSQVLIGALAPAGGDLKSDNANMRPLEFLRGLGCLDGNLRPVHTGACRTFRPALADGISLPPAQHAPRAEPALRAPGQRRPRKPEEDRAPARRTAAPPPPSGRHRAARPVARRVRLPDQPARQAPRGLPRRPGPLPPAGGVHRLARPARRAAGPVPVAGRAGTRRAEVHRLAVGAPRRQRRAEARPRPLRRPDLGRLRGQGRLGPGAPRRRAHRDDPAPGRRRRDAMGDARHGPDRDRRQLADPDRPDRLCDVSRDRGGRDDERRRSSRCRPARRRPARSRSGRPRTRSSRGAPLGRWRARGSRRRSRASRWSTGRRRATSARHATEPDLRRA